MSDAIAMDDGRWTIDDGLFAMAIRYTGDVEVRIQWDPRRRLYVGSVRDPRARWRTILVPQRRIASPASSEAYDYAARVLVERAERELGRRLPADRDGSKIRIRRVFQAPCPRET
jgi:Arc/MetJ family transcription regulator